MWKSHMSSSSTGADATAQDRNRSTPLHGASSSGNVDLAQLLVEHGANVTAQDKDGSTPLHRMSSDSDVNLARFLVERGCRCDSQEKDGETPAACWRREMVI